MKGAFLRGRTQAEAGGVTQTLYEHSLPSADGVTASKEHMAAGVDNKITQMTKALRAVSARRKSSEVLAVPKASVEVPGKVSLGPPVVASESRGLRQGRGPKSLLTTGTN